MPGGYGNWLCANNGDSVINGVAYKLLSSTENIFTREDTLTGKVFARRMLTHAPYYPEDTMEQLLFDYSWQLNDTATYIYQGVTYKNVVTGIDSVVIRGTNHYVWHFAFGAKEYTVIEGIGCLIYPYFPIVPVFFEVKDELICYTNSTGSPVLSKAIDLFDNSVGCALGDAELTKPKQGFALNPVSATAVIVPAQKVRTGSVIIMNASGETVYRSFINNADEIMIDTKDLANGHYLYRVKNDLTGTTETGKFIKM